MRLPAGLITITAVPAVTVLVSDFIGVEFVGATGLEVLVEVGDRAKPCGVPLRWVVSSGPRCGLRCGSPGGSGSGSLRSGYRPTPWRYRAVNRGGGGSR